jgi:hypothetical protein
MVYNLCKKPGEIEELEEDEKFEEKTATKVQELNDGTEWVSAKSKLGTYLGLINPADNLDYINYILKTC